MRPVGIDDLDGGTGAWGTTFVGDVAPMDQADQVPGEAPAGVDLFPVMAVLLAQVLDLDQQADKGGSSR